MLSLGLFSFLATASFQKATCLPPGEAIEMCCILQLFSNPKDISEQGRGILAADSKADFKVYRQLYLPGSVCTEMMGKAPHHFLFCPAS